MKKIVLISSLLLVALTGCAKSSSDESSTEPQTKNAVLGDRYTDAEASSLFSSASVCADIEVKKITASQVSRYGILIKSLETCNLIGELSYEQLSEVSSGWLVSLSKSSTQSLSTKVIKLFTQDQLQGLLDSEELTDAQAKVVKSLKK
jgi:hypothetical protein